ncbi:hypothetical protein CEXT_436931 [Caerostris extrusa]|uniref:Uncharacterized protein n=1 Tax=Caerostris extrusa TaxID=172846 RepID=A0AAV4XDM7_CAEEX|nr:hypothetical protein CEXT_436931 [Caerostris extrusa]
MRLRFESLLRFQVLFQVAFHPPSLSGEIKEKNWKSPYFPSCGSKINKKRKKTGSVALPFFPESMGPWRNIPINSQFTGTTDSFYTERKDYSFLEYVLNDIDNTLLGLKAWIPGFAHDLPDNYTTTLSGCNKKEKKMEKSIPFHLAAA